MARQVDDIAGTNISGERGGKNKDLGTLAGDKERQDAAANPNLVGGTTLATVDMGGTQSAAGNLTKEQTQFVNSGWTQNVDGLTPAERERQRKAYIDQSLLTRDAERNKQIMASKNSGGRKSTILTQPMSGSSVGASSGKKILGA